MVLRGSGIDFKGCLQLMRIMNLKKIFAFILLVSAISSPQADEAKVESSAKSAANHKQVQNGPDYIAIVGGERISMRQYVGALRKGMRDKFYHGKTPENELKKFRKEVAEGLVTRLLSIQEAKRQGIKPDMKAVKEATDRFDQSFKDNPDWPAAREQVLKELKEKLIGDSLAEELEKKIRDIPLPNNTQLKKFYENNKDLFTTPEKIRVSLIMLKVDPSSPSEIWQQANEEARDILERINKGADFADMARIHSSDKSAQDGGDMGYIHTGMLGAGAQKVLDIMEPGEISAPVVLLEGVAIFRLDDRVKPTLNPLEVVKERATKVYLRNEGEKAWNDLIARLKAETKIEYNDAPWR